MLMGIRCQGEIEVMYVFDPPSPILTEDFCIFVRAEVAKWRKFGKTGKKLENFGILG